MKPLPNSQSINAAPSILAPGRKIRRETRKVLPDGRVLKFVWRLRTYATPAMTYVTRELLQAPALDCPCTPSGPDDVVCCSGCSAVVCARRHSFTCRRCGRVFCSTCLQGVNANGVAVIACEPCAKKLTASWLSKVARGITGLFWG